MEPSQGPLLYEGKAKMVFSTPDPTQVLLRFKDDATAFNGVKQATIGDKGRINCAITALLLDLLATAGVPTHLVRPVDAHTLLCRKVEIVPIEVVVRNRVAGSLVKRYGLDAGARLPWPLVELFVKSDALGDPLIGDEAAVALGYIQRWELAFAKVQALRVNEVLSGFWAEHGLELVDFKLEFGRHRGRLLLADEITPDGSRLWDAETGQPFDKDVFRQDLADLGETYRSLYARIFGKELQAP